MEIPLKSQGTAHNLNLASFAFNATFFKYNINVNNLIHAFNATNMYLENLFFCGDYTKYISNLKIRIQFFTSKLYNFFSLLDF